MTFSLKQFAKFLYETKYLQNAISMYNVFVSIIKKKKKKKRNSSYDMKDLNKLFLHESSPCAGRYYTI